MPLLTSLLSLVVTDPSIVIPGDTKGVLTKSGTVPCSVSPDVVTLTPLNAAPLSAPRLTPGTPLPSASESADPASD
jgi:hypothetical protein